MGGAFALAGAILDLPRSASSDINTLRACSRPVYDCRSTASKARLGERPDKRLGESAVTAKEKQTACA
jgi:hypothetical protein